METTLSVKIDDKSFALDDIASYPILFCCIFQHPIAVSFYRAKELIDDGVSCKPSTVPSVTNKALYRFIETARTAWEQKQGSFNALLFHYGGTRACIVCYYSHVSRRKPMRPAWEALLEKTAEHEIALIAIEWRKNCPESLHVWADFLDTMVKWTDPAKEDKASLAVRSTVRQYISPYPCNPPEKSVDESPLSKAGDVAPGQQLIQPHEDAQGPRTAKRQRTLAPPQYATETREPILDIHGVGRINEPTGETHSGPHQESDGATHGDLPNSGHSFPAPSESNQISLPSLDAEVLFADSGHFATYNSSYHNQIPDGKNARLSSRTALTHDKGYPLPNQQRLPYVHTQGMGSNPNSWADSQQPASGSSGNIPGLLIEPPSLPPLRQQKGLQIDNIAMDMLCSMKKDWNAVETAIMRALVFNDHPLRIKPHAYAPEEYLDLWNCSDIVFIIKKANLDTLVRLLGSTAFLQSPLTLTRLCDYLFEKGKEQGVVTIMFGKYWCAPPTIDIALIRLQVSRKVLNWL
ncbi:hypothetical protein B0O99DRAFT_631062 [Bisporella sp. PMI_857]|nr:hypothetical protein B0O99DRAFT_631062 [Bisporella sp. PMI_857]